MTAQRPIFVPTRTKRPSGFRVADIFRLRLLAEGAGPRPWGTGGGSRPTELEHSEMTQNRTSESSPLGALAPTSKILAQMSKTPDHRRRYEERFDP